MRRIKSEENCKEAKGQIQAEKKEMIGC